MKKLFTVLVALLLMGFAPVNPLAQAKPPESGRLTMIVIGGNDDPTISDFETRLRNNGWIPKGNKVNVVKITYPADVSRGDYSTDEGSKAILAAYDQWCQGVNPCELHGASMGTNPSSVPHAYAECRAQIPPQAPFARPPTPRWCCTAHPTRPPEPGTASTIKPSSTSSTATVRRSP